LYPGKILEEIFNNELFFKQMNIYLKISGFICVTLICVVEEKS
jgi:hypothetical protein